MIDTQSVKNAATATGCTGGFDAGKLVKGRKRLAVIDTLGNVLASWVVPAGESVAATAIAFWDAVAAQHPLLGQVHVVMGTARLRACSPTTCASAMACALRNRHTAC